MDFYSLFRFIYYYVISRLLKISSTFFAYYSKQNSRQFHTNEVTCRKYNWRFSYLVDSAKTAYSHKFEKEILCSLPFSHLETRLLIGMIVVFKLQRATQLTRSTTNDPTVSHFKIN